MEDLKPCPFCGEAKELNTIPQHGEWFVGWCSRCDAVGPLALTKELATAAWNKRGPNERALGALEGCANALGKIGFASTAKQIRELMTELEGA